VVNVHGDVISVNQPGRESGEEEGE